MRWSPALLAPFRYRAFAIVWSATLVSNTGNWMHDVAAGWLMSELTEDPVLIALLQTVSSLPVLLFTLFAGALGDRLDRRKLMIAVQLFLLSVAGTLGVLAFTGRVTPSVLLLFSFLMGVGMALAAPARQAIMPALVPRDQLRAAIALTSVGFNGARAIGPAIGGAVLAGFGVAWAFLFNCISYLAVVLAMLAWKPEPTQRPANTQSVWASMGDGLASAWRWRPVRIALLRGLLFVLSATVVWGLLPLIIRRIVGGEPGAYGLMVTCLGAGAVFAGVLLPTLRERLSAEAVVRIAMLFSGAGIAVLLTDPHGAVAAVAFLATGMGWVGSMTTFNTAVQLVAPDSYRARIMACYVMMFASGMGIGSLLWGQIASVYGLSSAMLSGIIGIAVSILIGFRFPVDESPIPAAEPADRAEPVASG